MSLVLPVHLAPRSSSRSLARAADVVGGVCLVGAFLIVQVALAAFPDVMLWPALFALLPTSIALLQLGRRRTAAWGVTYLVVGTACHAWYALAVMSAFPAIASSDMLLITLPQLSLIVFGAPARSTFGAVAWSVAGFVAGEAAAQFAALVVGAPVVTDVTATSALLAIIAVRLLVAVASPPNARAQKRLRRAARSEQADIARVHTRLRASALLHDTVLGHLAAIVAAAPGPVAPQLRTAVERDIEMLAGREWLNDPVALVTPAAELDWDTSALGLAIEAIRDSGLEVDVSGDVALIGRLTAERAGVLALAVRECLVNVIKHAATDRAEVALAGTSAELSIMVVDGGRGFAAADARPDRLGLRQSVRQRIEEVGGSVRVWSRPGSGTTIVIRIPAEAEPGRAVGRS